MRSGSWILSGFFPQGRWQAMTIGVWVCVGKRLLCEIKLNNKCLLTIKYRNQTVENGRSLPQAQPPASRCQRQLDRRNAEIEHLRSEQLGSCGLPAAMLTDNHVW